MPDSKASWLSPKQNNNKLRKKTDYETKHFCMLTCLIWSMSVHCTKAEPNLQWFGPGVCRALITSIIFFSIHYCFEGETLNEVVRAPERERERARERKRERGREPGPYCWPQPLCHGWPRPPSMASLRPRAEQDSRTRPHQLPLLPASQTWYRHGALHCMNHAQQ